MTMHTVHPDSHEHGLVDDCPRCAEHAEDPFAGLDERSLARLVLVATDPERFSRGHSETELIAAAKVLTRLEQCGKLFESAPNVVAEYLRRKWGVPVWIG